MKESLGYAIEYEVAESVSYQQRPIGALSSGY